MPRPRTTSPVAEPTSALDALDAQEAQEGAPEVAEVETPTALPEDAAAAKLAALEKQNADLQAMLREVLTRRETAAKLPDAEPAPAPLALRKLIFTHLPDLRPTEHFGPIFACGVMADPVKGGPIVFRGTADDERPNAMVLQKQGDELIANDRCRETGAVRYCWAGEG